jgi:RNA polymerase sigma factor (sigma-70 family)
LSPFYSIVTYDVGHNDFSLILTKRKNMTKEELSVFKAAQAGDKEAFGVIVNRYQSLICAITYSSTGDINLSEDIAQETFLAAWNSLGELRSPTKLRAWLCAIARNLIKQSFRQRKNDIGKHAISLEANDQTIPAVQKDQKHIIDNEKQEILWQNLEKIPDTYREPMILYYREQQSIKKVSELLDLSEDAVKQRLSRGRKMLKQQVASFVEDALGNSGPGKTFTLAVLAALPATQAQAVTMGLAAASYPYAKLTFWACTSLNLCGILVFLIAGGYLTLACFIALSLYMILRRPGWLVDTKAMTRNTLGCMLVLAICFAFIKPPFYSLFFAMCFIEQLLVLHPGCPEKIRILCTPVGKSDPLYLWKRWDWNVPPKNWKTTLGLLLFYMLAFIGLGIFVILKTKPHIAWGYLVLSFLMALSFAVHSFRLIAKILNYSRHKKTV